MSGPTFTLAALNAASPADFTAALGDIFERSPWVAERACVRGPFASLAALFDALCEGVRGAAAEQRLALIRAHPDLAAKVARAEPLSQSSTSEQHGAGLDHLADAEHAAFHRLNDAYRAKFGFPFIICVRRHTKDSILDQFERRTKNDPAAELDAALGEIFHIAALRLSQRVTAPDRLAVDGSLTTHVLDTHAGRPAAGVAIELVELSSTGERVVVRAVTDADGRTAQALIANRPIPIGRYELRFDIGGYFAKRQVALADPPFLGRIPIRFAVAEPAGHYHIPLLATPWGYTTYRGS